MKIRTSLFALLLVCVMLTLSLAACNNTYESGEDVMNSSCTDISTYTIVRVDSASGKLPNMTAAFKKTLLEYTKAELSVTTDYLKRGETLDESKNEILIGDTNRTASIEALEELKSKEYTNGFIIKATENKIVIVGMTDGDTILGIKYFINNYVYNSEKENTVTIKNGDSVIEKTGKLLYMTDNFNAVVLETLTDIYSPNTQKSTVQCTYGKIIKLEHNGENNGMLLATHETCNWTDGRYPVYRSTDDGQTWTEISRISDTLNKNSAPGWQPCIFELPADVGNFKEGTLLYAGCSRINNMAQTAMTIYQSTDLGETWKAFRNVDIVNGGIGYGLWEPVLMYEEETGRVYCFYSDDSDPEHDQKLVYKYSTDLITWSKKYEMVACENPALRPGMVALTKMGNGKYALAYEMCGDGCQIYIKYADSLDGWEPADHGKLIQTLSGEGMGSAPAIAWTPDGGECGTLFVTAHHVVNGSSSTKCDLFLSFDYGETFIDISNPIPNKPNDNIRSGYSPGFFVDKDGTVYYVNNPEYSPGGLNEKLMFAKIKVY
ncbi:MAG: exo-alpha-sialidase [Ruminococcaceae bacterium]|nr:exo-alpha-sialidase [Oscillospiraceae bacterium]